LNTYYKSKAIWNQHGNEYLPSFEGSVHYLLFVSHKREESRLNGGEVCHVIILVQYDALLEF
jgi:hypothetical protein